MQLLCCEADVRDAIQDRYGCRRCAIVPDDPLYLCCPSMSQAYLRALTPALHSCATMVNPHRARAA